MEDEKMWDFDIFDEVCDDDTMIGLTTSLFLPTTSHTFGKTEDKNGADKDVEDGDAKAEKTKDRKKKRKLDGHESDAARTKAAKSPRRKESEIVPGLSQGDKILFGPERAVWADDPSCPAVQTAEKACSP